MAWALEMECNPDAAPQTPVFQNIPPFAALHAGQSQDLGKQAQHFE